MLNLTEGRYDRQERIWWWDQERLTAAKVLVVGAGALGNEIVKNLVLVGVGLVDIVDMDVIEHSNLARCALFRDCDEGRFKAEALAEAAGRMNPHVSLTAFTCRVQELGSAWVSNYDLVIAGLDNREARLWVNAACRRLGMHWVDGAIEGLQGLVRVFGPDGPCYECTLGEADLAALSHRRSCALLSAEEIAQGHTPTNATTAAVVAGIEVQEGIKLLVGRDDLVALTGRVWRVEGETMLSTVIAYQEDPDCLAHDRLAEIVAAPGGFATMADAAAAVAATDVLAAITIYLSDDLIVIDACRRCGEGEQLVGLRSLVPTGSAVCATCAAERPVSSRSALAGDDPLALVEWGRVRWPRAEYVAVLAEGRQVHTALRGSDGVR